MIRGKGIFIWIIRACVPDYNMVQLASICKDLGLTHVEVKILDGSNNYNQRQVKVGGVVVGYKDDLMQPMVNAFHAMGIEVGGFCAPYPSINIPTQAQMFARRLETYGFDYGVIDAEGSWEISGSSALATAYMQAVRSQTSKDMYLTSFRFPSVHQPFPFAAFMDYCEYWMPQVYWVSAHNPAEQLDRCVIELRRIKDVPIIPVGPAYSENSWRPSTDEMNEFDREAHVLDLPGETWWELDSGSGVLRFPDMYSAIKAHAWPYVSPVPYAKVPIPEYLLEVDAFMRSMGYTGPAPDV